VLVTVNSKEDNSKTFVWISSKNSASGVQRTDGIELMYPNPVLYDTAENINLDVICFV
jgi:hypothetical protein